MLNQYKFSMNSFGMMKNWRFDMILLYLIRVQNVSKFWLLAADLEFLYLILFSYVWKNIIKYLFRSWFLLFNYSLYLFLIMVVSCKISLILQRNSIFSQLVQQRNFKQEFFFEIIHHFFFWLAYIGVRLWWAALITVSKVAKPQTEI